MKSASAHRTQRACLAFAARAIFFCIAFPWIARSSPIQFEVASIKPSASGILDITVSPGGTITFDTITVKSLIQQAFAFEPFQIIGGPSWFDKETFDIIAKLPSSAGSETTVPTDRRMPLNSGQREMLKGLLKDRFGLDVHAKTVEGRVYVLTKADKKTKLIPTRDPNRPPWVGGIPNGWINENGMMGKNASMGVLVSRLREYLEAVVIDQTELSGSFDFVCQRATDAPQRASIPTILSCIEELGLKLRAKRGPIPTIVIDHVARPTPN